MAISIPTALSAVLLDAVLAQSNTGGNPQFLFYDVDGGAIPGVDAAATGDLAVTVTTSSTFPAAGGTRSSLKNTGFVEGTVTAGGPHTPDYFRMYAGNGTTLIAQGIPGTGAGDINFSGGLSWSTGGKVNLTQITLTIPETCS